jgi:hypothetical protein
MQLLKLLTIFLVSAHADPSGNPSPHEKTEAHSGNAKASSRGSFRMTKRASIKNNDKDNLQKDERKHETPRHHVQPVTVQPSVPCTGTRKIVHCKDDVPESVCKEDLIKAGVQVLLDMPKTIFFAVCVDSAADAAIVAELTTVEGIEDDPVRTLSVMEGSMVKRDLPACEQVTPYGIDMVKAPEFWSRYNGTQGAGIKVCVIDTGLDLSHEDIRDGDVSGSDTEGLLSPVSCSMNCR